MAFDDQTRRRLLKMVTACRSLLTGDFDEQLRSHYGIYAKEGRVFDIEKLTALDDTERETARLLRERIDHLAGGKGADAISEAVGRILREQAFTVMNRFAAIRMAEERKIIKQSVGGGLQSNGFRVFEQAAGAGSAALGSQYERYLVYLDCLFDELSLDLGVLFDRSDALGLLFPTENAVRELFEELNHPDIADLWPEDETIGWIYQYWNSKEERKAMRDASAAPRNSRELAVRNQFFTPRYVVEFLTDNTLGRIWYEMCQGQTRLKDQCRYLVRRPDEVFLGHMTRPCDDAEEGVLQAVNDLCEGTGESFPEFSLDCEDDCQRLINLAHTVNGYARYPLDGEDPRDAHSWLAQGEHLWSGATPEFEGITTQALLDFLFVAARADRHNGGIIKDEHGRFRGSFIRNAAYVNVGNEIRRRTVRGRSAELSQEELLKQPVYIPHRPVKDPREIRLLDPACGSMHFGLYAFDLFEAIYEEAWDLESSIELKREDATLKPLRETYASKDEFLKDVPRLIIEHNIHGVDIDPRAVQIAGLSLWLRAQKSWNAIPVIERPRVRRSNIVCAEPMPGSDAMLEDFVQTLDPPLLGELVKTVFDKMQLAGEAGTLLKIEEEIRTAIDDAREKWENLEARPRELFPTDELNRVTDQPEFSGLDNALRAPGSQLTGDFFDTAEERIYTALRDYAESAEAGDYQRRLFAEDAAHGFAFIDLCRKRFDAVVMNPPFGQPSERSLAYLKRRYPSSYIELFATVVERGVDMCVGLLGAITSRAFMVATRLKNWRRDTACGRLSLLADLGEGVMDSAFVECAAYILTSDAIDEQNLLGLDFRATGGIESFSQAAESIQSLERIEADVFSISNNIFKQFPNRRIIYCLDGRLLQLLQTQGRFEPTVGTARQGITTFDDERFIRLRWEVPPISIGRNQVWVPLAKGGAYARYYGDLHLLMKWSSNGRESRAVNISKNGTDAQAKQASSYWWRRGLSYSIRSQKGFSARILPEGCLFTGQGPLVVSESETDNLYLLGWINSELVRGLIEVQSNDGKFMSGLIKTLPWIPPSDQSSRALESETKALAQELVQLASANETNSRFVVPVAQDTLAEMSQHWSKRAHEVRANTQALDRDWNRFIHSVYKTTPESLKPLQAQSGFENPSEESPTQGDEELDLDDSTTPSLEFASILVAYALGRWDIRYATGERQPPELPDPFDPLPVCPPGMLQNADGLPAAPADVPDDYPLPITWPGILIDEENHPDDIVGRVREALQVIWKDKADAIEQEACEILKVKDKPRENLDALRVYFRDPNKFFKDHLARYSKSRRKAPIYWPLSTESGSFTLWIYYHRLDGQTLYTCIEIVEKKREDLGKTIQALRSKIGTEGSADERQKLEDLTEFQSELKTFQERLLEVAALPYRPNLNDGVQITAAPLWQLFRHKPWQTVLKKTWGELKKGKYDWAHLAMSIWPDRVVPLCTKDRSLAIAHGIEDLFWVSDLESKKKEQLRPLKSPEEEIKLLRKAEFSAEDIEAAEDDVELAKKTGIRDHLWVEQPEGNWRRRLSLKEEVDAEIARRKGK